MRVCLLIALALAACSSHQVRCDARLTAINRPAAAGAASSAPAAVPDPAPEAAPPAASGSVK